VEDSVKFYSSYLPVLYNELWKNQASLEDDSMHTKEKMLRRYSRPKVALCTNYEEAKDIFSRYSENVLGVITDMGFPKNGAHEAEAGLALVELVKDYNPELPVLIQSANEETSTIAVKAQQLGARYACKNSPLLLHELRTFMTEDLMIGPFKFQDGVTGKVLGEVNSVVELLSLWEELPPSSVAFHARHQHLSRWFFARAEFGLAKRFRNSDYPADFIDETGRERADWLRNWILSEVRAHRNKMTSFVENPATADPSTLMIRCGQGSLGGKGRGFRFLHTLSERFNLQTVMPEVELVVPKCFVLATSVFDDFMEENALLIPALNSTDDSEISRMFTEAALPLEVMADLRSYLEKREPGPLAVRSSSLFEDAFLQPFAGIYKSVMLPDASSDLDARLDELAWAVKMVYASTFTTEARNYAESTLNRTEEEKMAVILQPLVGDKHGDLFYPSLAGVANAVDFYPLPHTSTEHGCAQLGLGLGFSVVDGMPAAHFSLGDTSALTAPDELRIAALDLTAKPGGEDLLVDGGVIDALQTVRRSNRAKPAPQAASAVPLSDDVHGEKVVFKQDYGVVTAPEEADGTGEMSRIGLKELIDGEVPLAKALSFLLRLGTIGLGCPVEIEFALKLRKSAAERHELHLLQIRPQAQVAGQKATGLRFQYLPDAEYAAVTSTKALGNGRFDGICDVVYVSPEVFDRAKTDDIAREISQLNEVLTKDGSKYLLMAPGRWGSADKLRGIPVAWQDIDGASFIVETQLPGDENVPLSQGSHFFQNIMSFGLGYATVDNTDEARKSEVADYAYWDSLPEKASEGNTFVRHVQLERPLEIVVDGLSRHGVVMKQDKAFDVYVGQVDAFMALQESQFNSNS